MPPKRRAYHQKQKQKHQKQKQTVIVNVGGAAKNRRSRQPATQRIPQPSHTISIQPIWYQQPNSFQSSPAPVSNLAATAIAPPQPTRNIAVQATEVHPIPQATEERPIAQAAVERPAARVAASEAAQQRARNIPPPPLPPARVAAGEAAQQRARNIPSPIATEPVVNETPPYVTKRRTFPFEEDNGIDKSFLSESSLESPFKSSFREDQQSIGKRAKPFEARERYISAAASSNELPLQPEFHAGRGTARGGGYRTPGTTRVPMNVDSLLAGNFGYTNAGPRLIPTDAQKKRMKKLGIEWEDPSL